MLQFGLKTIWAKKATTGGGEATDNVEAEGEDREGEEEGKGKAQSESD